MDYNKLIELRKKVSERIEEITAEDNFELSIRHLTGIHERLFKGIFPSNGSLRRYNLNKDEDILNGESIDYPDYHTVATFLRFAFNDESKVNYHNLKIEEIAKRIANFTQIIWQIHPFIEGNTRTTCIFIENYLKSLGYPVDNDIFKENAEYFRNTLVRASYKNEAKQIPRDIKPLEDFFISALTNHEIEKKDLYIKELFIPKKTKKRIKK